MGQDKIVNEIEVGIPSKDLCGHCPTTCGPHGMEGGHPSVDHYRMS